MRANIFKEKLKLSKYLVVTVRYTRSDFSPFLMMCKSRNEVLEQVKNDYCFFFWNLKRDYYEPFLTNFGMNDSSDKHAA